MTLSFPRIAAGLTVGFLLSLSYVGGSARTQFAEPTAPAQNMRFDPIPTLEGAPASEAELRDAYEFVARHEGLIKYVPCFCGCETLGHKSVESCFITSRTPDGAVKWNKHGAGCRLCLDVVKSARELHAAGRPAPDIRQQLIERFYKTRMTPTPAVPDGHDSHVPVARPPGAHEHSHR